MNKQIPAVLTVIALAALAACSAAPTASEAAQPGEWHADGSAPADTTGRVPNMMGSGN